MSDGSLAQPLIVVSNMTDNSTTLTATTAAAKVVTTTTATTTTISFDDLPGTLLDLHQVCVSDWDHVYDGHRLTPREYTTWNALHISRVTLCTWIILSHVAIILFILGKGVLRANPKNPLIANLALANILLAVFIIPVKQHFILNPDTANCGLEMGWTFITDFFQPSLALFTVLSLVFERFVFVYTQKNQKKLRPVAVLVGTATLLIMPWILSLLFLLPTFMAAFKFESTLPNSCVFKVDEDYLLAAQILSFIIPSIGVFILTPYTGLLDFIRPRNCVYEYTPKGESLTVTAVISFLSIFSEAPYCVVRILMMRMECNNPYCSRFSQALNVTMWIRICKTAICPFIWLLYTDIRKATHCHLTNGRRHNDEDDDDDEEGDLRLDAGVALVERSRDEKAKNIYKPVPSTSAAVVEPVP